MFLSLAFLNNNRTSQQLITFPSYRRLLCVHFLAEQISRHTLALPLGGDGPHHLNHWPRRCPWACLQSNLVEAFSQLRVPLSERRSVVKLSNKLLTTTPSEHQTQWFQASVWMNPRLPSERLFPPSASRAIAAFCEVPDVVCSSAYTWDLSLRGNSTSVF